MPKKDFFLKERGENRGASTILLVKIKIYIIPKLKIDIIKLIQSCFSNIIKFNQNKLLTITGGDS